MLDRLQISAQQLSDLEELEEKEIVKGVARAGRVFYSSRVLYRLKGILLFMSRGLTPEEAQRRVDHPVEEGSAAESRRSKRRMPMQLQSRMRLWREGRANLFLLCTILAKQTRRLGRMMPDRHRPELITIAMENCADYELTLDVNAGVPEVVREEAMQIGRLTRRPELAVASGTGPWVRSQVADVISTSGGQGATESRPTDDAPLFGKDAIGTLLSMSSRGDSPDFRRNLHSVQRKHLMSYSNGVDPMHLRQLRAMAENLCTLANRHRENHNYVVAHALYGRALSVAQEIHTSGNDGDVLGARIRADQQAVFEILRSGKSGMERPLLEKAQKVGH